MGALIFRTRIKIRGPSSPSLGIGRSAGPVGLMGKAAADMLKARKPDLKILFMSGYNEDVVLQTGVLPSGSAFLSKPFSPDDFLRKLREVIESEDSTTSPAIESDPGPQNR